MASFRTSALIFILILNSIFTFAQPSDFYFPPLIGNTWQTTNPSTLGFCAERIDSLYQFLAENDTKSFILLQDGKIVLEQYFGTFQPDSLWYWASAGKSLSAFLVGQAQEEGLLQITDKTSDYLGLGWTSAPPEKEDLITIWHQLSMTNGLDDLTGDANCTTPSCLQYKADAGTRWAYHNAPYHLIHDVLEEASGQSINIFTKNRLLDRVGMKGFWINHVMYGRARDMARYGLLTLAQGVWNGDTILHDQDYIYDMTHRSQELNKSYGYLWWLNGQESYLLPGLQFVFNAKLIPNAPDDMFAALGKNDQKIHIIPSKGWVIVRQGNEATNVAGGGAVPIVFDNDLWAKLNQLECTSVSTHASEDLPSLIQVFPNPTQSDWQVESIEMPDAMELYDTWGRRMRSVQQSRLISAESLPAGAYWLRVQWGEQTAVKQVIKG